MPPTPWRTSETIDPAATYVVTITRLPLRSHLRIPSIMRATLRIMRELKTSDGLIGYALKADLIHKTFWTASAWRDDAALARFVRSDTHRTAMANLQPHMADAHIETTTMPGSELPPTWPDINRRLAAVTSPSIPDA
jgi:quinol monooxygenase YgiN